MLTTNRWITCFIATGFLIASSGLVHGQFQGRGQVRTDVRGTIRAIDATAGTIKVATFDGRQAQSEKSYTFAKNVEVALGDGGGRRAVFLFKEGKLSDLIVGTQVSLTLSADQSTVDSILAEGPTIARRAESCEYWTELADRDFANSARSGTGGKVVFDRQRNRIGCG